MHGRMETRSMGRVSEEKRKWYASLDQKGPDYFPARMDFEVNGSEIDVALGLSNYRTRKSLYTMQRIIYLKRSRDPDYVPLEEHRSRQEEMDKNTYLLRARERGKRYEDRARRSFERLHDCKVMTTGIHVVDHPTILIGSSPDGIVHKKGKGAVGVLECKCPFNDKVYPEPSVSHILQTHAEIQSVNVGIGWLHCWTSSEACRTWTICRDDRLWEAILEEISIFVGMVRMAPHPSEEGLDPGRVAERYTPRSLPKHIVEWLKRSVIDTRDHPSPYSSTIEDASSSPRSFQIEPQPRKRKASHHDPYDDDKKIGDSDSGRPSTKEEGGGSSSSGVGEAEIKHPRKRIKRKSDDDDPRA